MSNPTAFLSTLAESAAAIVAIVGGFLVSRLVALSSEREGLRRQLRRAEDQLSHVTTLYHDAHETRVATSVRDFTEWTLEKVIPVAPETLDREDLLERIPRASSRDEMEPVLDALLQRVADAKDQIGRHVYEDDTSDIDLDTLRQRGLLVAEEDLDLYEQIMEQATESLPRPSSAFYVPSYRSALRHIVSSDAVATDMRRLDDAIHEEHDTAARKLGLETEIVRLRSEIELVASPIGVFPAIVILALYSVVGVVLPVIVMAANPDTLETWKIWVLAALFAGGLAAVLGYMFWYVRTLNEPIPPDASSP
jgi:hypothetical protein